MARTDARATHDLDEAFRRGEAYLRAGADILFIEAPRDERELALVARTFQGVPLVVNLVEDGKTPMLSPKELGALGYKIVLYPISALLAVARRLEGVYAALLHARTTGERVSFTEYNEIVGLPEYLVLATALKDDTCQD